MILSSPFSRQNRNLQTWTNGTTTSPSPSAHHQQSLRRSNSPKKPAPEQPAPAKPVASPMASGGGTPFRSHTLNRADFQQRRRWNHRATPNGTTPLRRNASSLGHYPAADSAAKQYSSPNASNASQIYAPASIASPSEFSAAHKYKQPPMTNGESQHYAATSFRGQASSEAGRSGRDSALGHLLERFGTLRRRTKWLRPSRSSSAKPMVPNGAPPRANGGGDLQAGLPAHLQPVTLDPEIYATGKRQVEADAIYAEGLSAIDGNCQKRLLQYELNEAVMSEGETRTIIEQRSQNQSDYQALVGTLTNWINDELSRQRIIVRDLQDDLYDGQILGKLVERLHNIQLDIVEVTQNETTQRYKLRTVLDTINRILSLQARWARIRWSVDGIHGKNMVEIIQLLVTLALYYRAPVKLPPNVRVMVLVVQKSQGQLVKRSHEVQLTDSLGTSRLDNLPGSPIGSIPDNHGPRRDAFDALIEIAPEKLAIVEQSLVNFVNRHLNKISMSCLATQANQILNPDQFSDGLMLVFLIASLEDYFVPLGNLFTVAISPPLSSATNGSDLIKSEAMTSDINNNDSAAQMAETALEPTSYINTLPIHKLHNVNVALQLIEEAGVPIRDRVRAEDIVNGDLKSVLRVLYVLFSRYKHL